MEWRMWPPMWSEGVSASLRIAEDKQMAELDYGERLDIPSSRTSTIAIFEGGVEASRFEEVLERRICESSVEERRGSVATVCIAILRIRFS
jgi:hypothetical protein